MGKVKKHLESEWAFQQEAREREYNCAGIFFPPAP
jgi:hypothetical protein